MVADKYEHLGVVHIGSAFVFILFIAHFLLAARKMPFRFGQVRTFHVHAKMLHHEDTWLWAVQVLTALLVLVFGVTHMWVVIADLPIIAAKSAERMQDGIWPLLYGVLLPAIVLHAAIGFYRLSIKFGMWSKRGRKAVKFLAMILTCALFALGCAGLLGFMMLPVAG